MNKVLNRFDLLIMDAANKPNNKGKPTSSVPVQPNNPKNRWQELPADRPKRSWKPRVVSLLLKILLFTFFV